MPREHLARLDKSLCIIDFWIIIFLKCPDSRVLRCCEIRCWGAGVLSSMVAGALGAGFQIVELLACCGVRLSG